MDLLSVLCIDLQLIVHRILFESIYDRVREQYKSNYGKYWIDNAQVFALGGGTCIMDRNVAFSHRSHYIYIYNFVTKHPYGKLPARY